MPSMHTSSAPIAQRPDSRRGAHIRPFSRSAMPARRSEGIVLGRPLVGYLDAGGRTRELLALPGHAGSVLVLDRDAATLCDRRLVAHLSADEPCENTEIVCRHYLEDVDGRWCRRVRREDLEIAPIAERESQVRATGPRASEECVVDRDGNVYRLGASAGEKSAAQLRWHRGSAGAKNDEWEQVALRDVVAALESYEPMRTLTECALAHKHDYPGVLFNASLYRARATTYKPDRSQSSFARSGARVDRALRREHERDCAALWGCEARSPW